MKNGKPVVLVVEESPIIRMGAVDLIESAGYEALEAGDADEAIRILESRADIDLVFTDAQMPGTMDGIKLSHYIRDGWPPVKLIVASGAANQGEYAASSVSLDAAAELLADVVTQQTSAGAQPTTFTIVWARFP